MRRAWNRSCDCDERRHIGAMLSVILQNLIWVVFFGVVLFLPAGTLAYPGGWAFIGAMLIGGVWLSLWLYKRDPELLRKRLTSPLKQEQKPWDRVFLTGFIVVFIAWMAFMAWDARQHAFVFPLWAQMLGF